MNGDGRIILHSDLNCFFASVECVLDPMLRGKPVAVCGSTEERHGIVLAKTEEAKRAGVRTGMVTWQARQLCPGLIAATPHYEYYIKFSDFVRKIYRRYTDFIEPFGIDECWLDVTGDKRGGEAVAEEIRNTVREELGLTVSVGVSFNKIFAKLGSDMKKPDAVTLITRDNFRDKVWRLPVEDMMFCGTATARKLRQRNICTVGDLAILPPEYLRSWFGVNGVIMWKFANGLDDSPVMHRDFSYPVKSVGHGTTFTEDINNPEEIRKYMLELAQDIGRRLRKCRLAAESVTVLVRDSRLNISQLGITHGKPTQSPSELSEMGWKLFSEKYTSRMQPVRSVTLRAVNLVPAGELGQLDVFSDYERICKHDAVDDAVYCIRDRYGKRSILPASLITGLKMADSDTRDEIRNFGASVVYSGG